SSGPLLGRGQPVRALHLDGLRAEEPDSARGPLGLSRSGVPGGGVGVHALLRRVLRPSLRRLRRRPARHRQGALPEGQPGGQGQALAHRDRPARQRLVWGGRARAPPPLPRDPDLVTDQDLDVYAAGLARNGFFGPDSWYMNGDRNVAYAARARDG